VDLYVICIYQNVLILFFEIGVIESIAVSSEGALFCSVGDDKAMKVFDVVNFDMINMLKLG
jgi:peptidylprolyl isomerase domain and WD repeat-containing protein 1